MAESIYNKKLDDGKGTLVGNWQEERELREFTGAGRSIVKEHIPKKHLNFEEPIVNNKKQDNTHDRIHGVRRDEIMDTENYQYGTSTNPADALPKYGKRTHNMEKEIQGLVAEEMKQKEREEEVKRNQRFFETQNAATYIKPDYTQNVVGRKVMKTQNGQLISMDSRDEQLMVEHGFIKRSQQNTDEEIMQQLPQGDYTQQRPITIYTEALNNQNFYMSSATGVNPFGKSNGLTQPLNSNKGCI